MSESYNDGTAPGAAAVVGHVDARAVAALADASGEVAGLWDVVRDVSRGEPAPVGLAAGVRPAADVEVLAGAVAVVEFELARRMHTARAAGCLPLHDPGGMLAARGWSIALARRLARCGALAAAHPNLASAWGAGLITSEHVDPITRLAEKFTAEELQAVLAELDPHWGTWSPAAITRFLQAADRLLHPPGDPSAAEAKAYESRFLAFSVSGDSVLIAGSLPRLEGELVIAAIEALAEKLRCTADHVPAAARRADALVQLVNDAHTADLLPTRGGMPVALNVTLEHTALGEPLWRTSRGLQLTDAEARFTGCDASITPVLVESPTCTSKSAAGLVQEITPDNNPASPAARVTALAALMFDTQMPLAVGRTFRTATPAQRRALAVRDRGCIIPGCQIPPEACQTHHLDEWATGGHTDIDNLVLLCWGHHRQVDLHLWTITPTTRSERRSGSWPANHNAPFTITRAPRHHWRT